MLLLLQIFSHLESKEVKFLLELSAVWLSKIILGFMFNNVCWFNLFKLRFLGDSFLAVILGHGEAVLTFLGVVIFIIPIFIDLDF